MCVCNCRVARLAYSRQKLTNFPFFKRLELESKFLSIFKTEFGILQLQAPVNQERERARKKERKGNREQATGNAMNILATAMVDRQVSCSETPNLDYKSLLILLLMQLMFMWLQPGTPSGELRNSILYIKFTT